MRLASQEQIDRIIGLKRQLVPGQEHLDDEQIKLLIRENELYEPNCLAYDAATELIEIYQARQDWVLNEKTRPYQ